jgi:hypothetical protein
MWAVNDRSLSAGELFDTAQSVPILRDGPFSRAAPIGVIVYNNPDSIATRRP